MPSAITKQPSVSATLTYSKVIQLVFLCSLLSAVNESCREMKDITYSSLSTNNDRVLSRFEVFLCKLAQICDTAKGGDTITALVALRSAHGPEYVLTSNSRKEMELDHAKGFLHGMLELVGRNPDELTEKALKKQVLWRILEFNFPRVDYYLKRISTSLGECMEAFPSYDTDTCSHLSWIEARAEFPRDMSAGSNAKSKFLSDCENLIRGIQHARETGFSKVMNERASGGNTEASRSWSELRHYLGRLHSYRQATECIVGASKDWLTSFTVRYIPSSRAERVSLPRPMPSPQEVIQAAFEDINPQEYESHIEELRGHNLDYYIKERLQKKMIKQPVHCEVHLQSFLVREQKVKPSDYWGDFMFVATSKPPCRLCHYYFSDPDNSFQVQSSHMNVYQKWRLPDGDKDEGEDAIERREELLDDIIEQLQQDTLHAVKEKLHQGKRNDSRTETRTGLSTVLERGHGSRSDSHCPSRLGGASVQISTDEEDFEEISSATEDDEYADVGVAR